MTGCCAVGEYGEQFLLTWDELVDLDIDGDVLDSKLSISYSSNKIQVKILSTDVWKISTQL